MDLKLPGGTKRPGDVDWFTLAGDSRFTESQEELRALYELARLGQIRYEHLEKFPTAWLVYLGAHDPAAAVFEVERKAVLEFATYSDDQRYTALNDLATMQNKLEQNARRAKLELAYRRERATRRWTIGTAIAAAMIGVIGGIIGANLG